MEPAARVTDQHNCPVTNPAPHVGGPILRGEESVKVCGRPAARAGDVAECKGAVDAVATGCPSVWIGGKPAARRTDQTRHEGLVVTGCPSVFIGDPASDAWLGGMLAVLCPDDKEFLAKLRARGVTVTGYDRIYWDDPYYDGTKWTTRRFEGGGSTDSSGTNINMLSNRSPGSNAATLYHEGTHTGQPSTMAWRDKEYEAYTATEKWRIAHGMPPQDPSFRKVDASGNTVVDEDAVKKMVDKEYPGVTAAPSGATPSAPPEQVIGRDASGNTVVQRGDGSTYTRPPRKGDSYAGAQVNEPPGGRAVNTSQLRCP